MVRPTRHPGGIPKRPIDATEARLDTDAKQDAHDAAHRQLTREIRREADRNDKLLLSAIVLFLGPPAFAIAGWLIWLASEQRPWLISFGTVLVVIFLVSWPVEYWLKRQA
jgi:hypothetical protein